MSNSSAINTDGILYTINGTTAKLEAGDNASWSSTSNMITYYPQTIYPQTIGATWVTPAESLGGTIGIGATVSGTYGPITLDRFEKYGVTSYSDILAGLRPGTPWFKNGTLLKLQSSIFLYDKEGKHLDCMTLANSFFAYLGVNEDLVMGKERHLFLAESGQIVQYYQDIGNLGWRDGIKSMFNEIEDSNGSAG